MQAWSGVSLRSAFPDVIGTGEVQKQRGCCASSGLHQVEDGGGVVHALDFVSRLHKSLACRIQARMHAMHASLHAQEVELVTDQQAETEAAVPPPTSPWVVPDLPFPRDQAFGSPLFTTPAQGLLGGSLAQASGLQVGLGSTQGEGTGWHCPQVVNSSSSSSSSSSDAERQGLQVSSTGGSGVSQGSGMPVGGALGAEEGSSSSSSSSDTWRIERSRLGLAFRWMERLQQGSEKEEGSSSRGDTSSQGGLCERLFYGFSLPLRPAGAMGL
eukprot:1145358-Pelagomonas_calceolata.AAC.2